MFQFKPPAAHPVLIRVGEAQGFTPLCTPRASCHIRLLKQWRSSGQREGELSLWGGKRCKWGADESAPHVHGGEEIGEIWDFLEWVGGTLGGDHHIGCFGCEVRGLDTRVCFLVRRPSSPFRGYCVYEFRFFKPDLHGCGHCRLLGRLLDRLRRGIRMWVVG